MWPFPENPHTQFEALLKPHLSWLYRLSFHYTGDQHDAEDLVQELLLKLYPRLQELQQIEKLEPWLARVLYRLFVDTYRKSQRSVVHYTDEDNNLYNSHENDEPLPEEALSRQIDQQNLSEALEKLEEDQRLTILLHDVEGYNLQEIHDMTGIAVGTLKSRLSRSRKKLQMMLTKMERNSPTNVYTNKR